MKAWEEQYLAEQQAMAMAKGPTAEELRALNNEFAKDARAKLYWIYRTRNTKELKVNHAWNTIETLFSFACFCCFLLTRLCCARGESQLTRAVLAAAPLVCCMPVFSWWSLNRTQKSMSCFSKKIAQDWGAQCSAKSMNCCMVILSFCLFSLLSHPIRFIYWFFNWILITIEDKLFISAMARVTMTRAAVSMRPSAHSPLDNVSTKYNPIRLLKGAPPGQV